MSTFDRIALYATLVGVAFIGYKLMPLGKLGGVADSASRINDIFTKAVQSVRGVVP